MRRDAILWSCIPMTDDTSNDAASVTRKTPILKKQFDEAHQDGMKALRDGDMDALTDALKREREIIEQLPRDVSPPRK